MTVFLRIRRSAAARLGRDPQGTRYRFYICRSERDGTRVIRRDLAYCGAITDFAMQKSLMNVERVYRDVETALEKIGALPDGRANILASMALWCPRPDPAAIAVEARKRDEEYAAFYQRMRERISRRPMIVG